MKKLLFAFLMSLLALFTLSSQVTSSTAVVTVNGVPQITTQPSHQTVCEGGVATFTIVATGTGTVTYQWRKAATPISGATSATFVINPVALSDAGSYNCVVTDDCGSVTSTGATLNVNEQVQIVTQPSNATVCIGDPINLSVTATGTGLTYQWRKNSTPISGATSSTYSIGSAILTNSGNYDVVVSGTCP